MKKSVATAAIISLVALSSAHAKDADLDGFYAGGGLASNSLEGWDDSAFGFQIFGGYDLGFEFADGFKTAVEVGFMKSGSFETTVSIPGFSYTASADVDGLWTTGVVTYGFTSEISGLFRLGLDLGDDDGLMFGFGGDYKLNDQIGIRAEYVIRDHLDSIQGNVTYSF